MMVDVWVLKRENVDEKEEKNIGMSLCLKSIRWKLRK